MEGDAAGYSLLTAGRFISLGAGVQSSTMLLMAEEGEIGPRPDGAVFADTQWEPPAIYDHLDWLADHTSIPIHRVTSGDLKRLTASRVNHDGTPQSIDIPAFVWGRDGSKGMVKRQCTVNFKVKPIRREVRRLMGMGVKGVKGGLRVEQWLGISTDEAIRMRDSDVQWVRNRYPLIEAGMSRSDCMSWWQARYPEKRLEKSACMGCPYQTVSRWVETKRRYPADFEELVRIDHALRAEGWRKDYGEVYLHPSRRPLAQAVAASELQGESDGFGNECEGLCGV